MDQELTTPAPSDCVSAAMPKMDKFAAANLTELEEQHPYLSHQKSEAEERAAIRKSAMLVPIENCRRENFGMAPESSTNSDVSSKYSGSGLVICAVGSFGPAGFANAQSKTKAIQA